MESDKQWYISTDGRRFGPFLQKDLLHKAIEGQIDISSLVFSDGMSDWELITARPEFSRAFGHVPQPPAITITTADPPSPQLISTVPTPTVRRFSFFRLLLALMGGAAGYYGAMYAYYEMGIRLLQNPNITAVTGAAAVFFLGLMLFHPFSARYRATQTGLSTVLGFLLGAAGLYAAYYTYNPPQFEAYGIADGRTLGGVTFASELECHDWTQQRMFHISQTMANHPNTNYVTGGFKGYSCRAFCPNKWQCLMSQLRGGR